MKAYSFVILGMKKYWNESPFNINLLLLKITYQKSLGVLQSWDIPFEPEQDNACVKESAIRSII